MAQEIKMSAAGLKAMQEELEYLKTVRRKELAEEIKEARSHGDLSENSEYDEAKNTQGLVENRITELEQMIKNAVIIDESELSVDNVSVALPMALVFLGVFGGLLSFGFLGILLGPIFLSLGSALFTAWLAQPERPNSSQTKTKNEENTQPTESH